MPKIQDIKKTYLEKLQKKEKSDEIINIYESAGFETASSFAKIQKLNYPFFDRKDITDFLESVIVKNNWTPDYNHNSSVTHYGYTLYTNDYHRYASFLDFSYTNNGKAESGCFYVTKKSIKDCDYIIPPIEAVIKIKKAKELNVFDEILILQVVVSCSISPKEYITGFLACGISEVYKDRYFAIADWEQNLNLNNILNQL